MRRKSERTRKTSPEKKVEKPKRTRTSRRRKQSSSSDNKSSEENSPVRPAQEDENIEKKSPVKQTVLKENDNVEDKHDQVWQVKTAEGSGDSGEIKKLKICLARPPSTPESAEKSPKSKRKHSRTTSSSDTPSVEAAEDKKKTKHRSKRCTRDKEDRDRSQSSHSDNIDQDQVDNVNKDELSQSVDTSTGDEDISMSNISNQVTEIKTATLEEECLSKGQVTEDTQESMVADTTTVADNQDLKDDNCQTNESQETGNIDNERSPSVERYDKIMSSVLVPEKVQESNGHKSDTEQEFTQSQVLINSQVNEVNENEHSEKPIINTTENECAALNIEKTIDSPKHKNDTISNDSNEVKEISDTQEPKCEKEDIGSDSLHLKDSSLNGQAVPLVINRKRKWGSRPSKVTKQTSLTISTDILKDIIPDVKPVEFNEVIEEKKHRKDLEKVERPILPKIVIDNTEHIDYQQREQKDDKDIIKAKVVLPLSNRKISIVKDNETSLVRPPSPPKHKSSCILFITNLVRPFTLLQLKNLLQRTGKIVEDGFWIDKIKSKCFVKYETEDQAVETRHALHGVTWPVSNPKTLQVDFSSQEAFDKAKDVNENTDAQVSSIPGTVEDWLREQDLKREQGDVEKPWERKAIVREWDVGKGDKDKALIRRDERPLDKRRNHTPERTPEPAKKFKKEEEAPAKLLDDLFRKTKATPCIYWLPLSAETIAVKEEQRRQHMAEHERRMQEIRRHRRH